MPIRVLVVEDNAINQKVASLMLQRAGYREVDFANDGSEAVAACAANNYDLILMDCQMPHMDGIEATKRIRLLSNPQPIIIAVTAHIFKVSRETCLASGMNDFLSKPYRLEEFLAILDAHLIDRTQAV